MSISQSEAEKITEHFFNEDPDTKQLFKNSGLNEAEFKKIYTNAYIELVKERDIYTQPDLRALHFPIKKDLDLGVASIHITINRSENDQYSIDVVSKIFSFKIGDSHMKFENGALTRSEKIGRSELGASYTATLHIENGFGMQFEAHLYVKIAGLKKSVDFGPKWIF
ncbi:hypothetical protein WS67_16765 [Burkholderia singularis]|uniref:Uncharacterized protein n=1 Tax=Burkholderia singularis TaxID=1503053 RepID=A0A103E115_9BURK|nr:hypothetical protein [Burkholderia singularis]KVE26026.1 hypothetical protein WS67_16765 [Burkholderia singularis]